MKIGLKITLMIHAAFVVVHAFLNYEGKINPWEHGGYGMYTVPYPHERISITLIDSDKLYYKIPRRLGQEIAQNPVTGGCLFLPREKHLRTLAVDLQRHKIRFMSFEVSKRGFTEEKRSVDLQSFMTASFEKTDDFTYLYTEELCDKSRVLTISVPRHDAHDFEPSVQNIEIPLPGEQ